MRPISRLLLALVLALISIAPAAADAPAPAIVIDGSQLPGDVPALVSDGRVLVPLRGVFERLGAVVSYDAQSQTANASLNGILVQVQTGSRTAWVNGRAVTLDVGAREVAGRVMIPLRFVAQSLGINVDYDGPSNTVVIVSGLHPGNFAAMTSGPSLPAATKVLPSIESTSPAEGSLIGSEFPSIYARFNGGSSAVDPASVRVLVDGADVTGSSTISSAYVSYTPTSPLLTGQHTVSVTGSTDDGSPVSSSWSFRIDAGTSSDYTTGSYGGGMGYYGYGGGLDGFGWPRRGFGRFGFSPPGFSVFTPGSLFFVSGGVIEVIFVSQFFPFGTGFFTISGFPGTFPLTPWLGNPGCFWGVARVPFGVTAHNAIISARFQTPAGRKIVVRSTAPLQIEGERRSLPSDLRYAVLPHLINHPGSPRRAVAFERIVPSDVGIRPSVPGATEPHGVGWNGHPEPGVVHPVIVHDGPVMLRPGPIGMHPVAVHPEPIAIHPVIHPVIRPPQVMPLPGTMPIERFPIMQWQFQQPHAAMPVAPAKPK